MLLEYKEMSPTFLLARFLRTVLTLFGVVTLTFALSRLSGDPLALMLPDTATLADREMLRASLGLDQPWPIQYKNYLRDLLVLDLGRSLAYARPALDVILERVPATLELGVSALVLSALISIPLGIIAAVKRNSMFDRFVMALSLVAQSLPSFVIGILFILLFSVSLHLLPSFGRDSPDSLILPVATLTLYPLAFLIRLTRASVLDVINQQFIRTARAKGVSPSKVVIKHALRNALIPVVTVAGLQLAGIISGSAIVETVFAWPGIGWLAVQSIKTRDYPIIQGVVLISAFAFSLITLLVDILYTFIDPRIQYS